MPQEFGRYELYELLGRGGMGEVYRAHDTVRDRTVALKLLPKHLASDESFKTRFRRESRMAARLSEPHIVPIHDFGEIDGQLFLDMRLVDGRDLGSVLSTDGSLPLDTAVTVISQVAAALDAAHASGLVHRDVKPSNVLLTGMTEDDRTNPFAYLVDFGIARSANEEGTALTATSGTIGTVAYMSPERIGGEHGDRRTDVYALACVLYETITGRKPFDGEIFAIMYAHMNTEPPAVSALVPGAPPGLDEVIRKGMAKNPDDRYPTAGALAGAARAAMRAAALQPLPPPMPPSSLVAPPSYTAPPPSGLVPPSYTAPPPSGLVPPSYTAPPPSGLVPPSYTAPPPSGPIPARTPQPSYTAPPAVYTPPPPARSAPPPRAASSPAPNLPLGPIGPPIAPGWVPPPHPSGPIGPPGFTGPPPPKPPPKPPPNDRRKAILAVAALAAIVAAAVTVVVALSKGGTPSAKSTTHSHSTSVSPPVSASNSVPSLDTGPTGNGVTWANFASFSQMVGTKDGDTAHAFHGANCAVEGPETNDLPGIVDQVKCTFAASPVIAYVARFTDAAAVQNHVRQLTDSDGYTVAPWSLGGEPRGLEYTAPRSAPGLDITSTVCALPTYLVQFYAQDRTKVALATVHDSFWNSATFPDVVPPACSSDFLGTQAGSTAEPDAGPGKSTVGLDGISLAAFLTHRDSGLKPVVVAMGDSSETMVVGQTGSVTFWKYDATTFSITQVGRSTYPYDRSALGPPNAVGRGTVLSGMAHATFILSGSFSGDGSGNAVAYTDGPTGWGAIKAKSNGNLGPSGSGVGLSAIGLSQAFDFVNGQLETADCSTTLPFSQCGGNKRVLKFWLWNGSEFKLKSRAGLSK